MAVSRVGNSDSDALQRFLAEALDSQLSPEEERLSEEGFRETAARYGLSDQDWEKLKERCEDHFNRGQSFLKFQNWNDAIRELEQAATLAPWRIDIRFALGKAFAGRWAQEGQGSDREAAESCFLYCLDRDSDDEDAARELSRLRADTYPETRKGRWRSFLKPEIFLTLGAIAVIILWVLPPSSSVERVELEAPAISVGEWIEIFDGSDLHGWQIFGPDSSFSLQEGHLQEQRQPRGLGYLAYTGEDNEPDIFTNFEIELEIRARGPSNSGVFLHWQPRRSLQEGGLEVNLANGDTPGNQTGSLAQIRAVDYAMEDQTEWFPVHIRVHDRKIEVRVNDSLVNSYSERDALTAKHFQSSGGMIALQANSQDPEGGYEFRTIRIRHLPLR